MRYKTIKAEIAREIADLRELMAQGYGERFDSMSDEDLLNHCKCNVEEEMDYCAGYIGGLQAVIAYIEKGDK